MLRIKRICTDYFDFVEAAKDLSLNLLERGYEAKEIRRVFNIVSNLDRNSLIPYKKKVNNLDFSKNIPFFFMFNSNFSKFNKDLKGIELMIDQDLIMIDWILSHD